MAELTKKFLDQAGVVTLWDKVKKHVEKEVTTNSYKNLFVEGTEKIDNKFLSVDIDNLFEIRESLPSLDEAIFNHIYLIRNDVIAPDGGTIPAGEDKVNYFEEYILIENDGVKGWEKLGDYVASIDLEEYYKKSDVDKLVNDVKTTVETFATTVEETYATKTEVYTKTEADEKFLTEHQDISNLATKAEVVAVDTKLADYAKVADVYTKKEIDDTVTTLATKESVYTKTEIDDKLGQIDSTKLDSLATIKSVGAYLTLDAETGELSGAYKNATADTDGLMSKDDKKKLDAIKETYATKDEVTQAIEGIDLTPYAKTEEVKATYVAKEKGKGLSTNDFTTAEKEKLASLENYELTAATAETLGGIKVGNNLTITEDGTLSAVDTTYELAASDKDGLMSAEDKTKLNAIEETYATIEEVEANEQTTAESFKAFKTTLGITSEEIKYTANEANTIIASATSFNDADVKIANKVLEVDARIDTKFAEIGAISTAELVEILK